jgi:tetratricopeptide (TPR) repeat protein
MKRLMVLLLCVSGPPVLAQAPDPAVLESYAAEGEKALAERRYDDAARSFEKLRELSPETAEVHAKLGLIYYQKRDYEHAVPALRRAMKLRPTLPNVDVLLAMCLSELGRYREALPGLRKGFRQSSDVPLRRSAGLKLLRAYTGLAQDAEAVDVALQLTRLHPEDPEVLYHSSRLFANYAYLQTIQLSRVAPASIWMHQAAGELQESRGYFDAAIREYRDVLALDPRRPGIYFRLGRTLLARAPHAGTEAEASRAREEAMKAFEDELRLDPTNANASYELAEIHRKAGELDKAGRLFELALKHYPDLEDARIGLARVLISEGKPELAVPHLQKAISSSPQDDVAYYQLSVAYGRMGRAAEQERALADFQRLHAQKRDGEVMVVAPREVTKQELDLGATPKPPQ